MPGRIDELSRAIGSIEGEQAALSRQFEQIAEAQQAIFERLDAIERVNRDRMSTLESTQQARHIENLGRLDHLDRCTDELKGSMADTKKQMAETRLSLKMIEPLVASQGLSARKRGALMGFAVLLLSAAGWVLEHLISGLVQWAWTHIKWT